MFCFKNYKGIKGTSIELNGGGLYCIVGKNESGKTTILKGIRDAVNILTTGSIGNKDEYNNGIRDCIDLSVSGLTDDIIFGIEFELEENNIKDFELKKTDKILYFEFVYHFIGGTLREFNGTESNVYVVKNNKKNKCENSDKIINKIMEEFKSGHHLICPPVYYYSDFFTEMLDEVFFCFFIMQKIFC